MRRRLIVIAAIGVFLIPIPIVADVITTDILLLNQGEVRDEDVYVLAETGRMDGTIDGDLVIATGALSIGGTITGDLLVASSKTVTITGTITGSVRGVARRFDIRGTVGDDVAIAAGTVDVSGRIGRDLLVFAGSLDIDGTVGRDVRGRFARGAIGGEVGRDVDVTVSSVSVGADAAIGGDFLYRADREADIEPGAALTSQPARLSARGTFFVRLFLTAATIIGFLSFVLGGFLLFWLFRSTSPRAVASIASHPWRTLGIGAATVVAVPVFAVFAAVSLVGIPISATLIVAMALGLLFGPVPAVAWLGRLISRARFGLFGSFLTGAVVWRLVVWLLPMVGLVSYAAALLLGVGGWISGAVVQRRAAAGGATAVPILVADGSG